MPVDKNQNVHLVRVCAYGAYSQYNLHAADKTLQYSSLTAVLCHVSVTIYIAFFMKTHYTDVRREVRSVFSTFGHLSSEACGSLEGRNYLISRGGLKQITANNGYGWWCGGDRKCL